MLKINKQLGIALAIVNLNYLDIRACHVKSNDRR